MHSRRHMLLLAGACALVPRFAISQSRTDFRRALFEAKSNYDRLTEERFRRNVERLASTYIEASVIRQTGTLGISPDAREIEGGSQVSRFLRDSSTSDLHMLNTFVHDIPLPILLEIATSFRAPGFERVMENEFGALPGSPVSNRMLEALAYYALTSAALIESGLLDQSRFSRGEFCILPFWPFC